MLRSIYDGWKDVYDGCAPGVPIDGACGEVGSGAAVVYDTSLDYALASSSSSTTTDDAAATASAESSDDPSACLLRHVSVDDFALRNASVVCSSDRRWAADFSTWASRECVYAHAASAAAAAAAAAATTDGAAAADGEAAALQIANCTDVVASLANTSDTDGAGGADAAAALWLFCACAAPLATELPTYTDPAKNGLLAMVAVLTLGLVAAVLHLQVVLPPSHHPLGGVTPHLPHGGVPPLHPSPPAGAGAARARDGGARVGQEAKAGGGAAAAGAAGASTPPTCLASPFWVV